MRRRDALALGVLALAGCTSTQVDTVDLTKTRLLVLALGSNAETRARFEDALVTKIGVGGIAAIASHPLLPDLEGVTRSDVVALARGRGVTSVVVVAAMAVDAANGLEALGPAAPDAGGRLGAFIDEAMARGHITEGHVVFVTRVHRLATDELVWGGVSWAVGANAVDAVIDETTTVIADNIVAAQRALLQLSSESGGS